MNLLNEMILDLDVARHKREIAEGFKAAKERLGLDAPIVAKDCCFEQNHAVNMMYSQAGQMTDKQRSDAMNSMQNTANPYTRFGFWSQTANNVYGNMFYSFPW